MLYKNVYYVLQYNGIGEFELANCHPLIPVSLEGKDGWEIASGPYDGIGKAGKALCLAVESYDIGSYNAWSEARSDLQEVIEEHDNTLKAIRAKPFVQGNSSEVMMELSGNWIRALDNLRQLLVDWDVT